jgi:hypothetical protein
MLGTAGYGIFPCCPRERLRDGEAAPIDESKMTTTGVKNSSFAAMILQSEISISTFSLVLKATRGL